MKREKMRAKDGEAMRGKESERNGIIRVEPKVKSKSPSNNVHVFFSRGRQENIHEEKEKKNSKNQGSAILGLPPYASNLTGGGSLKIFSQFLIHY